MIVSEELGRRVKSTDYAMRISQEDARRKAWLQTANSHQSVSSSCNIIRDLSVSIESTALPFEKLLTTFSAKKSHLFQGANTLRIPPSLGRDQSVVLSHSSPLWYRRHRRFHWPCRCAGHCQTLSSNKQFVHERYRQICSRKDCIWPKRRGLQGQHLRWGRTLHDEQLRGYFLIEKSLA